jgi:hypothetical protein
MPATHTGGCQCGNVRYEFTADIGEVMACNCSRCGRLGSLLTFVPTANFRLLKGDSATTEYQFNRHNIHHLFCSTAASSRSRAASGPMAPKWWRSMCVASMASIPTS